VGGRGVAAACLAAATSGTWPRNPGWAATAGGAAGGGGAAW